MSYNTRSPAVKRLMKEAQELSESTELFYAKPLDDNLFEWHFTIRGPEDTEFGGGIYHGRIILPAEYPMKPPNILLMTPSGRFEINRKICLSISGYHPETWRPSWSIRTALLAIIGFMPTHGVGAIGSLEYPPEERRKLAKNSVDFVCPQCGEVKGILKSLTEASVNDVKEAMNLATQIMFTGDKEGEVKEEQNKAIKPQEKSKDTVDAVNVSAENVVSPTLFPTTSTLNFPQPNIQSTQPLSFEEWCNQMKNKATFEKSKGDECCLSQPSSTQATAGSCVTERTSLQSADGYLGNINSPVLSDDHIETINDTNSESSPEIALLNQSIQNSTLLNQSPTPNLSVQATSINQLPSQNISDPPLLISSTVTQAFRNNDVDLLLRRQTILLQFMAIVGGILGLFLAFRLSSRGSGMINNRW